MLPSNRKYDEARGRTEQGSDLGFRLRLTRIGYAGAANPSAAERGCANRMQLRNGSLYLSNGSSPALDKGIAVIQLSGPRRSRDHSQVARISGGSKRPVGFDRYFHPVLTHQLGRQGEIGGERLIRLADRDHAYLLAAGPEAHRNLNGGERGGSSR